MSIPNDGPIIYDPRGVVSAERRETAPRVHSLKGLRLAVLDNTKWNANKLLRGTLAGLAGEGFAATTYYRKESFSKPAADALIAEIARDNDVVLTAIGD